MSTRSLLELNHDCGPRMDDDVSILRWAKQLLAYRNSGNAKDLPYGIKLKWTRHHSDICPFDEPIAWAQKYGNFARRTNKS